MMKQASLWWLFAAAPITLLCLGLYGVGQQVYRQSANDPQIQLAEDGAALLQNGEVPAALVTRGVPAVDIANSPAPWVAVYDAQGKPLEAAAVLDNAPPQLPSGVFDTSNAAASVDDPVWQGGEYRFSWQPRTGVRQAVVLVQTKDKKYFVAAGKSLRESEARTHQMGVNIFIGWLGALILTFVWAVLLQWFFKPTR